MSKKIISIIRYILSVLIILGGIANFNIFYLLLGVSLLPVIYTFMQDKLKVSPKLSKALAIILPIIFLLAFGITTPPSKDIKEVQNTSQITEEKQEVVTTTEEPIVEPTPEPIVEKTPEELQQEEEQKRLEEEKKINDGIINLSKEIFDSLKHNKSERSDYDISINKTELNVKYKMSNYLDNTDLVSDGINDYCNFCTKFYAKNDSITAINFYISTDLLDKYGNKSVDEVLTIWMYKENLLKFNFNNLEYHNIYENFRDECDYFCATTAVLPLKTNEIFYVSE